MFDHQFVNSNVSYVGQTEVGSERIALHHAGHDIYYAPIDEVLAILLFKHLHVT